MTRLREILIILRQDIRCRMGGHVPLEFLPQFCEKCFAELGEPAV